MPSLVRCTSQSGSRATASPQIPGGHEGRGVPADRPENVLRRLSGAIPCRRRTRSISARTALALVITCCFTYACYERLHRVTGKGSDRGGNQNGQCSIALPAGTVCPGRTWLLGLTNRTGFASQDRPGY